MRLYLSGSAEPWFDRVLTDGDVTRLRFGTSAYLHMIDLKLDDSLPENTRIGYDLGVSDELEHGSDNADELWIEDWAPHLCLPGAFADTMPSIQALTASAEQGAYFDQARQDALVDNLLRFEHWHYTLQTSPKIVVLLNIFGHSRTPETFVILSGDFHYSFVYDVRLRHKPDRPRTWQITSSGIKNEFPHSLMEWLDRMNRWLYAPRSPLNWFTKRRRMRVTPRMPEGRSAGERLWNNAGIGIVELNEEGEPTAIKQLNSRSGGTRFLKAESDH
jgi:hypothetical protein